MMAPAGWPLAAPGRAPGQRVRNGCDPRFRRTSTDQSNRKPCSSAVGPWGAHAAHWWRGRLSVALPGRTLYMLSAALHSAPLSKEEFIRAITRRHAPYFASRAVRVVYYLRYVLDSHGQDG